MKKVSALSKELKVKPEVINAALGRSGDGDLTEQEEADIRSVLASRVSSNTRRFWSTVRRYRVPFNGRALSFKNHVFEVNDSTDEGKKLLAFVEHLKRGDHRIYEVIDAPYEDESEAARFREMLYNIIVTGMGGEISVAGIECVKQLFGPGELSDLDGSRFTPERLMERAVRRKSLR